jgi:hypothetical protein
MICSVEVWRELSIVATWPHGRIFVSLGPLWFTPWEWIDALYEQEFALEREARARNPLPFTYTGP